MPKDVVTREVAAIAELGVEIRLNQALGRDFSLASLLDDGYEAVLLALGTHVSQRLGVENDDAPGVMPGMEFLRDVNLGTAATVGDKVVVVGGGSVAMDAARSALRLQAMEGRPRDVTLVYRRSRDEMPAYSWEVIEGEEEGLSFEYLAAPERVEVDEGGRVSGLRCTRMELGEPDESGRRRPRPVSGSEFVVACDTIVPAVGLSVDLTWLSGELDVTARGTLVADRFEFATTHPKVFAAGDAVRGPATLIEAIGDGQRAAFAIERFLTGASAREAHLDQMQRSRNVVRAIPAEDLEEVVPRAEPELEPADERVTSFAEVVHALTADQARCEAGRCLRCDLEH
jgi:NADPH-dependent glutamate synthase beta subunit-like oxidoreductase